MLLAVVIYYCGEDLDCTILRGGGSIIMIMWPLSICGVCVMEMELKMNLFSIGEVVR